MNVGIVWPRSSFLEIYVSNFRYSILALRYKLYRFNNMLLAGESTSAPYNLYLYA
jgi:hypothetical protein